MTRYPPKKSKPADEVSVRLTRKYADIIDGVDLKKAAVGDRLDLSAWEAGVLIAEGWAEPERRRLPRPATAADRSSRPRKKR